MCKTCQAFVKHNRHVLRCTIVRHILHTCKRKVNKCWTFEFEYGGIFFMMNIKRYMHHKALLASNSIFFMMLNDLEKC